MCFLMKSQKVWRVQKTPLSPEPDNLSLPKKAHLCSQTTDTKLRTFTNELNQNTPPPGPGLVLSPKASFILSSSKTSTGVWMSRSLEHFPLPKALGCSSQACASPIFHSQQLCRWLMKTFYFHKLISEQISGEYATTRLFTLLV